MIRNLLPEEDAIDDPEDDDEADPTLPGDLWFRRERSAAPGSSGRGRAPNAIVYSRAFAQSTA